MRKITAAHEATLIDGDEPLLVLLKRPAGKGSTYFFGLAIPDDVGELDHYFLVSARPKTARRYFRGQCDLRYVFLYGPTRKYYTATANEIVAEKVQLHPFDGELHEDLLPDARLFSNSHTCDYGLEEERSVEETLFVDGEWEMPEFGDFYRRYSDIYLFVSSFKAMLSSLTTGTQRSKIVDAIITKPFKGGGSYMSLFKDLRLALPYQDRPGLDSISYASPGQMDIRGDLEVFENIEDLIENFLENSAGIKAVHDQLRSFMSKSKLLAVNAKSPVLSAEQAAFLFEEGRKLDAMMKTDVYEQLSQITEGNVIVANKVILAVYRRLQFTSTFFAQGRVGFEAHESV
ncbi:hypothetical protein [Leisingera caerulea]|uniref:Uncharacterized protein n=1 Tax=Leisingera caerulea TaxID=506591 RepID=A0A9Q9HHB5_LEICA|nr:hypothetical protein [Leisingera caerulea]UWQ55108.1 hypothetical protein K3721_06115 [Leisingera caerulea]